MIDIRTLSIPAVFLAAATWFVAVASVSAQSPEANPTVEVTLVDELPVQHADALVVTTDGQLSILLPEADMNAELLIAAVQVARSVARKGDARHANALFRVRSAHASERLVGANARRAESLMQQLRSAEPRSTRSGGLSRAVTIRLTPDRQPAGGGS